MEKHHIRDVCENKDENGTFHGWKVLHGEVECWVPNDPSNRDYQILQTFLEERKELYAKKEDEPRKEKEKEDEAEPVLAAEVE